MVYNMCKVHNTETKPNFLEKYDQYPPLCHSLPHIIERWDEKHASWLNYMLSVNDYEANAGQRD
jgi:hypothetical protein